MDRKQLMSSMHVYIDTATLQLSSWLEKYLPRTSDTWWQDAVMGNLSYQQRLTAEEHGYTKLEEFDLAALLRIADKSWFCLQDITHLQMRERNSIKAMRNVRNHWAHTGAALPTQDVILEDLQTLADFFWHNRCRLKITA